MGSWSPYAVGSTAALCGQRPCPTAAHRVAPRQPGRIGRADKRSAIRQERLEDGLGQFVEGFEVGYLDVVVAAIDDAGAAQLDGDAAHVD